MPKRLLVGTSKGLVILMKENSLWKIANVQFQGFSISMIYVDPRQGFWWIGISHKHWGEKLHCSQDGGKTWEEVGTPSYKLYEYRPGQLASLRKIWTMQHGGHENPDVLWLGTEPGGLFLSEDYGKSWHLNQSLWNHPSRLDDMQWFGAGKDFPFIHSIVLDPRNSKHLYIGVSCAGVFETKDAGKSWNAKNTGLVAAYLPNPAVEVGHDPHMMLLCPADPNVIWQQNHCGLFRTKDAGANWENVSSSTGFPKYGFALAIDERDPDTAWVIPAQSDEMRVPVDLKLRVCRTSDGGKEWVSVSKGLPESYSFDLILRHAFLKQRETLAFGSNNGNLYVSDNNGERWVTISQNLSVVNCLAFSTHQ